MQYIIIGLVVLTAITLVLLPLFRRPPTDRITRDEAALTSAIAGYRASLRAGTVCDQCLRDNPPGSKYCADCGAVLAVRSTD